MGLIAFLAIAAIFYVLVSLRVLKQYERGVVFLLGKFEGVRGPGLTLIFVPFRQMVRTSLRTVTMQVPSQKIITKDNVFDRYRGGGLLSRHQSREGRDRDRERLQRDQPDQPDHGA